MQHNIAIWSWTVQPFGMTCYRCVALHGNHCPIGSSVLFVSCVHHVERPTKQGAAAAAPSSSSCCISCANVSHCCTDKKDEGNPAVVEDKEKEEQVADKAQPAAAFWEDLLKDGYTGLQEVQMAALGKGKRERRQVSAPAAAAAPSLSACAGETLLHPSIQYYALQHHNWPQVYAKRRCSATEQNNICDL